MGEEEPVKAESEASLVVTTPPKESPAEQKAPDHDPFEKALVPNPTKEVSPSKSSPTPEKVADPGVEKRSILNAIDRDAALAKVENEKKSALIKAWEDNEKTKADNKAYKKLSTIEAWENTKRASVEAQLKQIEENIEKKKAEYAEKMKNKMAEIHRAAEEKRAMVEAKRGEDFLKVEETAAKCRATGNIPKKLFGCFSC